MENDNIVISPFNPDHLSTSSYDVTLGRFFFREQRLPSAVFNIWSEEDTQKVWGEPVEAMLAAEIMDVFPHMTRSGIRLDDLVIMIGPGETILGHTEEFIGGRDVVTTKMQARSSMGRSFIEVCKCAGWGDVGFVNRWTMEITNNSRLYHIPLVVGRRIAQIIFFHTGPILGDDYSKKGKYQSVSDLAELRARWKPQDMLPRLYRDREVLHPNGQEVLELGG